MIPSQRLLLLSRQQSRQIGRRTINTMATQRGRIQQQAPSLTTSPRDLQQQQQQRRTLMVHHFDNTNNFYSSVSSWTRNFATSTKEGKKDDKPVEEDKKEEKDDATEKSEETNEAKKESAPGDTLRDTVNRLKSKTKKEGDVDSASSSGGGDDNRDFLHKAADLWDGFAKEVGLAWQDLIKAGDRKDINKKLKHPEATAEGEKKYTGPVEIMVIDESEHLTAWERMQRRLTDAPIIQDMLTRSEEVYVKSGAKDVKQKVDHLREDAREAWETSQNPWVYRASSVYDTLTAETPESIAVKELRVLDPDFTLEDWRRDVVGHTLPQVMEWFLQGKTNQLKPWLGEGVFKRIASEIAAREQEKVQIDTHVLGIMNSEILAVEVRDRKSSSCTLLLFMKFKYDLMSSLNIYFLTQHLYIMTSTQ